MLGKRPFAADRFVLTLSVMVSCTSPAGAESTNSATAEDRELFEKLLQPPPPNVPSSIPEDRRAEYIEMGEIRRELDRLQPLFTRLGVAILQDIKELEQRPGGRLDDWAEALRRRHTSRAGIGASIVVTEVIGDRDGLEGLSEGEKVVRFGGVQRRLIRLAITGRISKVEFESLVKRLQGN